MPSLSEPATARHRPAARRARAAANGLPSGAIVVNEGYQINAAAREAARVTARGRESAMAFDENRARQVAAAGAASAAAPYVRRIMSDDELRDDLRR